VTRTSVAVGLAAAASSVAAWVVLPVHSASAGSAYDATARTDAATLTIANESIPTGIDIEGGGPTVKVHQDSVGIRDAQAQLPYAGDTVPGLPGLGASLFGFPSPAYPFLASSTAGTQPQSVAYPGVSLNADSRDYSTSANALAGEPGSGTSATARIDEGRLGEVVATATTAVDSVRLGPYGTLSNVRTVATVSADGVTGKVTRTVSSSIGRISVPGLHFTVPKQSPSAIPIPVPIPGVPNRDPIPAPPFPFPDGGTTFANPDLGVEDGYFTVTVPSDGTTKKYAVPAQPVLDALAAQGVTLRFQAPRDTATGVIAGSYIVDYTIAKPPPNSYYNGPTTITQTTAYAVASVNLQPVHPLTTTGGLPLAGGTGSGPFAAAPIADSSVATMGSAPALAGSVPLPAATQPGSVPTVGLRPAGNSVRLAGFRVGHGEDGPYVMVMGLAVAALLVALTVARFAVRSG